MSNPTVETAVRTPRTSRPWYRLHVLTFVVLFSVAVPTALANLSQSDEVWNENSGCQEIEFGWPFVWYWKSASVPFEFRFSVARLAINVFLWTAAVIAIAIASERFLRHFPPRFRWSLRTMMAAIGLIAVGCAWYASLRNRAALQDPLIAELEGWGDGVYLDRWGPRWLDLIGADRLRRRVVGARLHLWDEEGVELLTRVARLPHLHLLDLRYAELTPAASATLVGMKELRFFELRGTEMDDGALENLAGLNRLEFLDLSESTITDDDLSHLAALQNLEALYIGYTNVSGRGISSLASLERIRVLDLSGLASSVLEHLPCLPRLEVLILRGTMFADDSLDRLAWFPSLRTLDVSGTSLTRAHLEQIANVESIEELIVDGDVVSSDGFGLLRGIKSLKVVHINKDQYRSNTSDPNISIPLELDDGGQLLGSENDAVACRRALDALRRAKPGIVIDDDSDALEKFRVWRGKPLDDELPPANRVRWPWEAATVRAWGGTVF